MSKETKNTMPYNLEAEQSILGCVLIDNEIAPEVLSALADEDFYVESHKYVLKAFKAVYNARKPIDFVTVSDELENGGELNRAGGISYLTDLSQITPSAANYKYYLDIVKRDSTCRRLARSGREIAEYACDGHGEKEAIRFAEDKVYGISKRSDTSKLKSIAEILPGVQAELEQRTGDKRACRGVMTGINGLDKLTNGLQKTNLIILAARPGMGKTSLAMNIVEHAAVKNGMVCAVFSLEMSEDELVKRLLSGVAEVSQKNMMTGELSERDWKRLTPAIIRLEQCRNRITIDASSRVTPAEIFSKCRRIKADNGGRLDLVMIDYIQLMRSGERAENRVLEVAAITRELKIMAKELDVPVLALSQLSRPEKKEKPREPQLSDLRDSGAIEQDADMVMFIHRPETDVTALTSDKVFLNVAKNRHGGLDKIELRFKGELTKFVNPELSESTIERVTHNA